MAILKVEENLSPRGFVDPADAVEHRGIPGPVGADDGIDLPFSYCEGNPAQSFQPAKAYG